MFNAFSSLPQTTISVDLVKSTIATHSFILPSNAPSNSLDATCSLVHQQLSTLATRLDMIAVVAGGWCGGSAKDEEFPKQVHQMWTTSAEPAVLGAFLAPRWMNE
jgi:hypothetical protein